MFTGTPPRRQIIGLQGEREAEATRPVDETPDETPEPYNKEFEWEMKETLFYKKQQEETLKGQPFAERKDGRGSDRISEDQAPYNKKLKIGKPRL